MIRHLLFATLLCVLLFCVPDTQAQEQEWFHVRQGDYQTRFFLNGDMAVENTASLRTLLEKYLTIHEAMQNPRMNKGEWRRLMQKTPQEVSDLLATEGYFKVSTTLARPSPETADFQLTLPPRAKVSKVNLTLTGEIQQS